MNASVGIIRTPSSLAKSPLYSSRPLTFEDFLRSFKLTIQNGNWLPSRPE